LRSPSLSIVVLNRLLKERSPVIFWAIAHLVQGSG